MSHERLPSRVPSEADCRDGGVQSRNHSAKGNAMFLELGDIEPPPQQELQAQQSGDARPSVTDDSHPEPSQAPRGMIARKRTRLQIVLTFLPRWLLTVSIALATYGVLVHYSSRAVMSLADKRGFNAIITGLSIAQGLAIVTSLNGMVGDLRWWILSRRFRSRTKVERILRADSMLQLVNLAMKSRRPSIYLGVTVWLAVILSSQIAVASLNLLYSTAIADKYPLMVRGGVAVPDLSTIYTNKVVSAEKPRTLGAQQYTANSYGIVSTAYLVDTDTDLPSAGTIFRPGQPFIYYSIDRNAYYYVFRETSVESIIQSGIWAVAILTDRSVESTANCKSWPVAVGGSGDQLSLLLGGEETGGEPRNVTLPIAGGTDQTTYFTNTTQDCGEQCSHITAFESTGDGAWWYECEVTVGPVVNATLPEYKLDAQVAKLASAAIALQGYSVSSLSNNSVTQFQVYPLESVYGSSANGSVHIMANLLSRFTTGVIAAVAEENPVIMVDDTSTPMAGVALNITEWDMVALILAGVVGLQLVLEIVVAVVGNRVVVPPRGAVPTAQVLRAMTMDEMSIWPEKSSLWMRRQGHLPESARGLWRYSVTPVMGDDVYDLGMEKAPQQ